MEHEALGLAPILKLRNAPVFETLLKDWTQARET
jgi:hypothetical protein